MRFSIITVVYNGASLIAGTMQSVLNQSFRNIEYIIIDGKSKDKTLDIAAQVLKENEYTAVEAVERTPFRLVSKWRNIDSGDPLSIHCLSELDKGLYDAMNKGLRLATGDFVLFLNCGDRLFESTTLEKIAVATTPTTDILFGETMLVREDRQYLGTRSDRRVQKLPQKLTWQSMRYGMVVCHQSFLPSRKLSPQYIEGNLAADIDWVIACLKKAKNPTHTHLIVSEYLVGGISKQRHRESLKDRYQVLEKHFGFLANLLNHAYILWRAIWF